MKTRTSLCDRLIDKIVLLESVLMSEGMKHTELNNNPKFALFQRYSGTSI